VPDKLVGQQGKDPGGIDDLPDGYVFIRYMGLADMARSEYNGGNTGGGK
jgi:hypothetical protein